MLGFEHVTIASVLCCNRKRHTIFTLLLYLHTTIFTRKRQNIWQGRYSNPELLLEEFCPDPTDEILH